MKSTICWCSCPIFSRKFVERAAELTGARAGAFALYQDGRFQTVAMYSAASPEGLVQADLPQTDLAQTDLSQPDPALAGPIQNHLRDDHPSASRRGVNARTGDDALQQQFARSLSEFVSKRSEAIVSGSCGRTSR